MYLLTRLFFLRKNRIAFKQYVQGLRNENSGEFETAVVNYELALEMMNRSRFQKAGLKKLIADKLRTLQTVIDYNNGFQFDRTVLNITYQNFARV